VLENVQGLISAIRDYRMDWVKPKRKEVKS